MGGGEMIREVHLRHTTYNEVPYKFEAGTPDVAAAIGLGGGARLPVGHRHGARPRARARPDRLRARDPAARGAEHPHPRAAVGQRSRRRRSPSTWPTRIRTTWPRCSIARRSRFAPATTARCRSTSAWARKPVPGPASTSTPTATTSTAWPRRSTRSSDSSPAISNQPESRDGRPLPRRDPRALPQPAQLRHPRSRRRQSKEGANPLCGDRITLMLGINDDGHGRGSGLHRPWLRHQPGVGEHAHRRHQGQAAGRDRQARHRQHVLDNLGIEISPARMKCAMLSLETLQVGRSTTASSGRGKLDES